jgi:hypothetical protein
MAFIIEKEKKYTYTLEGYREESIPETISVPGYCFSAYAKVTNINGNKENIIVTVSYFNMSNNKVIENVETYIFKPSIDDGAKNFIAQAYEYLKTLPAFAQAVDC